MLAEVRKNLFNFEIAIYLKSICQKKLKGPKPTCSQIKAVSKQYQVCQGTVYYWLRTHFPDQFKYQTQQNGYPERTTMTQYKPVSQRKAPNYQRDNSDYFNSFNMSNNYNRGLEKLEQEVDKQLNYINELLGLNDEMEREFIDHGNHCQLINK